MSSQRAFPCSSVVQITALRCEISALEFAGGERRVAYAPAFEDDDLWGGDGEEGGRGRTVAGAGVGGFGVGGDWSWEAGGEGGEGG